MGIYLGATELSTGGGGGGGGFTKEYNLRGSTTQGRVYPFGYTGGQTAITLDDIAATSFAIGSRFIVYFNYPVTLGPFTIEKTGSSGGNFNNFNFIGTPPSTTLANNTQAIIIASQDVTVNPATDLALADGAQMRYFIIGGGANGYSANNQSNSGGKGGDGGRYRSGTLTISTASTDLVLTCGTGGGRSLSQGDSTIVYGSTTISTSGYPYGWGAVRGGDGYSQSNYALATAFSGVNGYGMGGAAGQNAGNPGGVAQDFPQGYGTGGACHTGTSFLEHGGGAGSVILYY